MKFKIYICISLLLATFAQVNAQSEPNFEQTVDYIIQNTKGRVMYPGDLDAYSRVQGYHLKDVKIEKNGKIELMTDQKFDDNKFSIIFNIFDLVEKVDYPDGIRAYKYLVHFNGLNVSKGYGITFATDADAQKIARAFRHLKKVCTKENSLFSEIPEEEKKVKLSREETLDYINKMVYFDGEPVALLCNGVENGRNEYHGYRYAKYGNKRLTYDSYNKSYSFGNFYEYYSWNNKDSRPDPWLTSSDDINLTKNIKFKYFRSIEVIEKAGGSGAKISYFLVRFSHSENNIPYAFYIFMPCNSGICTGSTVISLGDNELFYEKERKRLTKAFERLKELDSDDKDPFDD